MTVKEVILKSAELVGVSEAVTAYLETGNADGKAETETLLRCYNFVENALALDYLPLFTEESVEAASGEVAYSALSKAATHIVSVKNEAGESLAFRIFPLSLKTAAGNVTVRYAYAPTEKGLEDGVEAAPAVSARLLAYGVAAEYCTARGFYEEAAVWEARYKKAIAAAAERGRSRKIQSRRWV